MTFLDESNPLQDPISVDDVFYRSEMRKPSAEEVAEVTGFCRLKVLVAKADNRYERKT